MDQPAKGYKTSEFWVAVITGILTWLNQSGILGGLTIPVDSLESLINLAVIYILGRTGLKAAAPAINTFVTSKVSK